MKMRRKGKRLAGGRAVLGLLLVAAFAFFVWYAFTNFIAVYEKHAYPKLYNEYVEYYSEIYGVPENTIYAVIRTESGFDKDAVSSVGAVGLMQIMPDTYEWLLRIRHAEKAGELTDPRVNVEFGSYLLSYLYEKFEDWSTVFAAYNAGMNRVSSWLADERYSSDGKLTYIPYVETSEYVKKVNNAIIKYDQIYDYDA